QLSAPNSDDGGTTMQRRDFLKATGLAAGTLCLGDPAASAEPGAGGEDRVVPIAVRADQPRGEVRPVWRFFGYDEANYTYAPDGKKLLSEIAALRPQPAHIRTHHLLTSGDGTPWLKWSSTGAYKEDDKQQPVYNWEVLDRIFDTLRERGLKPFVE